MTTPLEALAFLSRQDADIEHFAAFHAEIKGEKNDRGAALLLATYVESALRHAITANLVTIKDNFNQLFRTGAPLHSFEAKIRIGFGMGLFGPQTKANLDCTKTIRNAFAHAIIPITFSTKEVIDACNEMSEPEAMYPHTIDAATGIPTHTIPKEATARQRYQLICETLAHNLYWFGSPISRGIRSDPLVGAFVKRARPKPLP